MSTCDWYNTIMICYVEHLSSSLMVRLFKSNFSVLSLSINYFSVHKCVFQQKVIKVHASAPLNIFVQCPAEFEIDFSMKCNLEMTTE